MPTGYAGESSSFNFATRQGLLERLLLFKLSLPFLVTRHVRSFLDPTALVVHHGQSCFVVGEDFRALLTLRSGIGQDPLVEKAYKDRAAMEAAGKNYFPKGVSIVLSTGVSDN